MGPKDRLTLYGCIGLAIASFGLLGSIVAEPLLRQVWSPPVAVATLGR
jgi:hypothetical protein